MNAKREARRKRDREDFVRATQAAVPAKLRADAGKYAGPTYREHLENKLEAAAKKYQATRDTTLRGVIRGLAIALALHENSYDASTEAVKKIERSFMK